LKSIKNPKKQLSSEKIIEQQPQQQSYDGEIAPGLENERAKHNNNFSNRPKPSYYSSNSSGDEESSILKSKMVEVENHPLSESQEESDSDDEFVH